MFDYQQIRAAIGEEQIPMGTELVTLPLLDPDTRLGVGRANDGAFVLVGPGQPISELRSGRQFSFAPWTKLQDVNRTEMELKDVCVLRFKPLGEEEVRDAVAAVFAGLCELTASTPGELGNTIRAMEGLFESGLRTSLARDTEIGLAGELLVIAGSPSPSSLVSAWRSDPTGHFDFSAQGERLEVKTTTATLRKHWFSSTQLAPIPGVCTSFLSVLLPIVETGSTVASVFASLTALTPLERARVRKIITETANEPPEVIQNVVFDLTAANAALIHLSPDRIPSPVATPGVTRMRWEAEIAESRSYPPKACAWSKALAL